MGLTLSDFLAVLESIAPAQWAESWDNPGLQVGSPSQPIQKIFASLDPTPEALMAASKARAQLLFTHHPLIFKPLTRLQADSYPGNVINEAVRRGIAVVAAHTNLDSAPGGINDILAGLLGLTDVEILQPIAGTEGVGLGRIGNLSQAVDLGTAARSVRRITGNPDIRAVGKENALVRRLAVVGGSGGGLLSMACEKGADLLVTGDVGHHVALAARALGIALIDAGHFHSEKKAFHIFAKNLETRLRSCGSDIEVETDEGEANPLWQLGG